MAALTSRMSAYPITMAIHPTVPLDTGREVERRILEPWRDTDRTLFPTHLNRGEPAREPLDPDNMAVPDGSWTARRKRPPADVSFVRNAGRAHAAVTAEFRIDEPGPVVTVADTLARTSDAFFGMIHRLTAADRDEGAKTHRPDLMLLDRVRRTTISVWGLTLQTPRGLPTLFWRTYFGPPYIDLIGRGLLLRTPAWEVTEVGRSIVVTLTEEPPSDETWPSFARARARAMAHLGTDLFWPNAVRTPSLPPPGHVSRS
jgi:hypothetical protein